MRDWKSVVAGALGGAFLAVVIVFAAARQGWLPVAGTASGGVNIRGYLLGHPELLAEMTERLQAQQEATDKVKAADAMKKIGMAAFFDPRIAFISGPADAKKTVVEFYDFNCPYCRLSLPAVEKYYQAHQNDTRFSFIGEPRMRLLEQDLPTSTTILGIDEYTACIVDLGSSICQVMGAGQVTVRHKGNETTHPAGSQFDLDLLKRSGPDREIGRQGDKETRRRGDKAIRGEATGEPPAGWGGWPECPDGEGEALRPAADVAAFVELLIQVRTHLRTAKQWGLADEIRQRLAELGIVLEDGPTETTWRQA